MLVRLLTAALNDLEHLCYINDIYKIWR